MKQKHALPLLAALFLPVSGGFDFVFIEYISAYIDSVSLVFARLFFSSLAFLAAVKLAEGGFHIQKQDIPRFFIAGSLGIGIYYVLEAIGISMTSAALSSLILATVPFFGMVSDRLVYGQKITPMKAIGVGISILGVALIVIGAGGSEFSGTLLGILILLVSAVFWASYITVAKPLHDRYSTLTVTTGLFTCGTIVLAPVFLLYHPEHVMQMSLPHWVLTIVVALIAIGAAQLLYMYGIRYLSVTVSSVIMNILPLVAIIVSWIVFHEMLSPLQLAGGAMIIASIIFTAFEKQQ